MGNSVPLSFVGAVNETFDNTTLNMLLPMHVQLDNKGQIVHVGPTFAKLLTQQHAIAGEYLLDYIKFTRPGKITEYKELTGYFGTTLTAHIITHNAYDLKAVAVPMPGNRGVLINFAFGVSLKEAVAHWQLNSKDFSPADPSVEMLYVIEVQSALLEESRSLNDRLNGQREEAEEKAYTDPLTALPNRRGLDRYIKRMCRRRQPIDFAVFLIDLDYFKCVNDTYGHAAGDLVLCEVADILLNQTRPTDIVVRTGGDEFVLVVADANKTAPLEIIANRIIRKIQQPVMWDGNVCKVGASIGIVKCHTTACRSVDFYLQAADEALYASKKNGRGQFHFAS